MGNVRRIYVEKKEAFAVKARELEEELRSYLGINGLEQARIFIRYDVENISDAVFEKACKSVFSEPPVDDLYMENIEMPKNARCFSVEYLPGQFDQRADSAMQCIQLISQTEKPTIAVAKVFVLKGNISEQEINKIKAYCINPVDSREASLEKPNSLQLETEVPEDVKYFEDFINKTPEELEQLRQQLSTAMSKEDFLFCQQYFRDTEKRNPTVTEIKVIDTYWSDHCRHTTFQTKIQNVEIENGKNK